MSIGVTDVISVAVTLVHEIYDLIKTHKQVMKQLADLATTLNQVEYLANKRGKLFEDSPIQADLINLLREIKEEVSIMMEKKKKSPLIKIKRILLAKDELEKVNGMTDDLKGKIDMMNNENLVSITDSTKQSANYLSKVIVNTERFIKNSDARQFWEVNFPTLLDVELSLFRGATRQLLKEELQESFPTEDFSEVFDNMKVELDEDGSGTISVYEYGEFTLQDDLVARFISFQKSLLKKREEIKLQEHHNLLLRKREERRREEEERKRKEEEERRKEEEERQRIEQEERKKREEEEKKRQEEVAQLQKEEELSRLREEADKKREEEEKKLEEEQSHKERMSQCKMLIAEYEKKQEEEK